MANPSAPPADEFTELEKTIARQIMIQHVMQYTTPGFLIREVDHGIWLPVHAASSERFH